MAAAPHRLHPRSQVVPRVLVLQKVKSGRTVDPFEKFARSGQAFLASLFDRLAEMRDAAIPQRVYPFDPARLQEDWRDALEAPVRLNVTHRDNPRFPLKAMAFLLNLDDIAREHGVTLDRRASIVRFKLDGSPFADDTSDYALWSPDAARKLHARMRSLALEHGYPAYADAFPTAPEPRQPVRLEDVRAQRGRQACRRRLPDPSQGLSRP